MEGAVTRQGVGRRAFLAGGGALVLAGALALSGCGSEGTSDGLPKVVFCLDRAPTPYAVGLYVAQDQGYFDENGLEVEVMQTDTGVSVEKAVNDGAAQFGLSSQVHLAGAFAVDEPASIIATATITRHSTAGLVSLRQTGVSGYGGLAGHSFSACDSSTGNQLALRLVELGGGNPDAVEIRARIGREQTVADALVDAGVDAACGLEGWDVPVLEAAGQRSAFARERDVASALDGYSSVVIANDTYLVRHPDEARAFMDALSRGYFYAAHNPETSADILAAAVPQLDADAVRASLSYLAPRLFDGAGEWGRIGQERWDAYFSWLHENEVIGRSIPKHHGFTNDYLEDAKK